MARRISSSRPCPRSASLLPAVLAAVLALAATLGAGAPPAAAAPLGRPGGPALTATADGSTSVELAWRVPPRALAVVIRYATGHRAPFGPVYGHSGGRIPPARHSTTITLLRPSTRYAFALFAYYGAGRYGRRVVARVTTGPDSVRGVQPFARPGSVTLDWEAPRAASYSGTVVRIARGYRVPATPAAGTGVRLAARRATAARLTGLTPATSYAVGIWTRDRAGRWSSRASARFTTLPAAPPTGTVTGTVADRTGAPLAGVTVAVADWLTGRTSSATTGPDGRYRLTVPAGAVELAFVGADATGGSSDATGYVVRTAEAEVRAGATLTENAALASGAAITGTVTDLAGSPLRGVTVYPRTPTPYAGGYGLVFPASGPGRAPVTGTDGRFAVKGLPDTATQVCFDASSAPVTGGTADAPGYLDRCAPGAVAVPAGTAQALPPVALLGAQAGAVVGTVTDPAGRPVAGVAVGVTGHAGTDSAGGSTLTDASGHYRVGGLGAGRYDVCADPGTEAVPAGGTGQALTCRFAAATLVAGRTARVDVGLRAAGAAAGRLRAANGAPVAGALVYLTAAGGATGGTALTDAAGRFEVTNLAPGFYTACWDATGDAPRGAPTGVRSGCYGDRELVPVRAGAVRLGLDAGLPAAGAISGQVHGAAGRPVAVTVLPADDPNADPVLTLTGTDGRYGVPGLSSGSYLVCAVALSSTGQGPTACHGGSGAVRVRAGRTTRGVDVTLPGTGSLTVTVTDGGGHPVSGVDLLLLAHCPVDQICDRIPLFDPGHDVATVGSAMTDDRGQVSFDPVAAGPSFALCALTYYAATTAGGSTTGYLDQCTSTRSFGLTVPAGHDRALPLTLRPAGAVAGRITDAAGHPLAGVRVLVSGSTATDYVDPDGGLGAPGSFGPGAELMTGPDGSYVVPGVRPGGRTVCFLAADAQPATTTGYLDQCVGGHPGRTDDGTPVTVPAAGTLGGVDLQLSPGSALTGRVVDAAGRAPLPQARVFAFDGTGAVVAADPVDATGRYRLGRLPAGAYRLCFWADTYEPQCYAGALWSGGEPPAGATAVRTQAGAVTRLPDARLRRG